MSGFFKHSEHIVGCLARLIRYSRLLFVFVSGVDCHKRDKVRDHSFCEVRQREVDLQRQQLNQQDIAEDNRCRDRFILIYTQQRLWRESERADHNSPADYKVT